jgi:hypothetical protein
MYMYVYMYRLVDLYQTPKKFQVSKDRLKVTLVLQSLYPGIICAADYHGHGEFTSFSSLFLLPVTVILFINPRTLFFVNFSRSPNI